MLVKTFTYISSQVLLGRKGVLYLIVTLHLAKLECSQFHSEPQKPETLQPHLSIPSPGSIFTSLSNVDVLVALCPTSPMANKLPPPNREKILLASVKITTPLQTMEGKTGFSAALS